MSKTEDETAFDPETAEPGTIVWHTSDGEGGPPDVAYQVILAKGESLWIGEITRDRYEDAGGEKMGLGGDGGWWLIHYKGGDAAVLGKISHDQASDLADLIASLVRRVASAEKMVGHVAVAGADAARAMAGAIGAVTAREREAADRLAALVRDPPRYRHVKRGSTYRVLASGGEVQTSRPIVEGDKLTTYVGEDGKVWHRLDDEFSDGRFVRLAGGDGDGT